MESDVRSHGREDAWRTSMASRTSGKTAREKEERGKAKEGTQSERYVEQRKQG